MPELPEVETIRIALARHLPGRTITGIEVFTPALRTPLAPLLDAGLPGRTITAVRRRARYLLIDLDDGRTFLVHLGMTGVIRLEPATVPRRKHEHLFLHLDGGGVFRYECVRRFSILQVCRPATPGGDPPELANLGAEPLDGEFTGNYLFHRTRLRKGAIKSFIMDNAVVVGIGNIYAAEALFAAKIHPLRPAGSLTRKECGVLAGEIRKVLRAAIAAGGTTVSDYRHVDGTQGAFDRELRIYGKAGRKCPACEGIVETKRIGGRSSCYCPRCQK